MRYTVVWTQSADKSLAEIWLASSPHHWEAIRNFYLSFTAARYPSRI